MKKRVLLLMPSIYGLNIQMKKNLEKMGYEVVLLSQHYELSLFEKGLIAFKEIVLKKDRKISHSELHKKHKNKILNGVEEFDITLVVNLDLFDIDFLKNIKNRSKKMFAYFFDGLKFINTFKEKAYLFDKIYAFDKDDVNNYPEFNIIHTTNFYIKDSLIKNHKDKYEVDFYYLCFYDESKKKTLNYIAEIFDKYNITYKFEILWFDMGVKNAQVLNKEVPYKEYLKRMNKSRFVLDVLLPRHSGLSFRVIESIFLKKKVVTTNPTIKEYDFYDSQNIFIIGERPIEELPNFLKSEYREIDKKIVEKYSFENWFNDKINY